MEKRLTTFRRMALITLALTLLLIFVGGFVRATGSGLGCPDWPKCWGCWWPPNTLDKVDLPSVLEEFRDKRPDLGEEDLIRLFNPTHLWIEYYNRLLGVLVGFAILLTLILSIRLRKDRPRLFWGSLVAFLFVGFQGWLGGVVVKSKLMPGMISLHLICAIILFCLLIAIAMGACKIWPNLGFGMAPGVHRQVRFFAIVFFIAASIQVVLGAQVREAIDVAVHHARDAGEVLPRTLWVEAAGLVHKFHRSFAWVLVVSALGIIVPVLRSGVSGWRRVVPIGTALVLLGQMITGITLDRYGMPPGSQIFHLGLGCSAVCLGFFLVLALRRHGVEPLIADRS